MRAPPEDDFDHERSGGVVSLLIGGVSGLTVGLLFGGNWAAAVFALIAAVVASVVGWMARGWSE